MTKKNLDLTYDKLRDKVNTYIKDEDDLKLLDQAYHYALEYHAGEKRLTGDDYITHPLHVTYILAETNADIATLCAGMLHDVMEDDDDNRDELISIFGSDVVEIIDGVTKINRLNFDGDKKSIIESHRKILVGLSEDVRVIIVKLADRLHNMRTLWVHSPKTQKEKANETLDILVPIASRLGMNNFKSELEDLCLRYSKPDTYFYIVEKLNQTRKERDLEVSKMIKEVSSLLDKEGIKYKIKGRAKSIYSIYKKLDKGKSFNDIYDLLALRVYVETEHECYQVLGVIHAKFKPMPKRFKDYIAMPKTNMYQSLHTTVFGIDGNIFEIQIRTYEMDRIAEHGIASHWSYKEKGSTKADLQSAMEQKLQFFRSLMEIKKEASDEEFVNTVQKEVLKENIYVFTPNGDVIELPVGATPIDFAYRVHSGVGDKMVGAIVNGSIVPLDYELHTNDVVKINTNKNSNGPSKEWINMAFTSQAKNKIKAFFNKAEKADYVKLGEEVLTKEVKKRKIPLAEFFTSENMQKIFDELKLKNQEELYVNLGNNKIPVGTVINIIVSDNISKEDLILKRVTTNSEVKEVSSKDDIIVEGIDKIKANVASCCKPIPGDEIVGYITKGHGITIHRALCPNIMDSEERIINVRWNDKTTKKYPALLLVRTIDNKNTLLDIIARTSNNDVIIESMNTINCKENFMYEITVLIDNVISLNKFMNDIKNIPNILDVERIIK